MTHSLCDRCEDERGGYHYCEEPIACWCDSTLCMSYYAWTKWSHPAAKPRWVFVGDPYTSASPHVGKTCHCDGPAHSWAEGWCPHDGPK